MNKALFLTIFFSLSVFPKTYQLSDIFIREMMCINNMGEQYCREWIKDGPINLLKYRKIETGCLGGVELLCQVVYEIQERQPTPIRNQLVALSEFGCKSANAVHCLIMASIDSYNRKRYLETGCQLNSSMACNRLKKLTKVENQKVKVDVEGLKKGIKDALNKMLGGKGAK